MITGKWGEIVSLSGRGCQYAKHVCLLLLTGMFFLSVPTGVSAMYDAVVPTSLNIYTDDPTTGSPANDTVEFGYWGLIVGTDPDNDIITQDFTNANFTAVSNTSGVSVTNQSFELLFLVGSISDNEVAGAIIDPFNSIYNNPPYLQAGESLVAPGAQFWSITFLFPYGYNGSATLNSSVEIGGETISYATDVSFINDNSGTAPTITGAQRLSTGATVVPEPVSTILFLTGGGIIAGRGYLKKRRKSTV